MTGPRVVPRLYDQAEDDFLDQILQLAQYNHWRRAHFRAGRTLTGWRTPVAGDAAGFPDLLLLHAHPPRLVVAELKSRRGRLSGEQLEWLEHWRQVGAEVHVWRPGDWDDIVRVLTVRRRG
jgi:hypothetical protein